MKANRITILSTVCCLLLLSTAGARAADKWTTDEVVAEAAWELLHLADWGQSRDISERPEYREVGPLRAFTGQKPSRGRVDLAMGAAAVLHPVVTHVLPKRATVCGVTIHPRAMWQYVTLGVKAGCVANNAAIGLRINF